MIDCANLTMGALCCKPEDDYAAVERREAAVTQYLYDAFLTHNWGNQIMFTNKFDNHERGKIILFFL